MKVRPLTQCSISRMITKLRRRKEQGATKKRLVGYVTRAMTWAKVGVSIVDASLTLNLTQMFYNLSAAKVFASLFKGFFNKMARLHNVTMRFQYFIKQILKLKRQRLLVTKVYKTFGFKINPSKQCAIHLCD